MRILLVRLLRFLRTVLPHDPTQMLLLCGLVCLTISPHLRWWPTDSSIGLGTEKLANLRSLFNIAIWPMIFAAAAGYFIGLWPGRRPALRLLLSVVFPAGLTIAAVGIEFVQVQSSSGSVLYASHNFVSSAKWTISHFWKMGPGFHFSLLGVVLVSFFALRIAKGVSTLPLRIHAADQDEISETEQWKSCKKLIWVFQGASILFVLPYSLSAFLIFLLTPPSKVMHLLTFLDTYFFAVLTGIVMLLLAAWLMGKENRKFVMGLLRLGNWRNLALGATIPLVITLAIVLGHYLFDRADWAMHWHGNSFPPDLDNYFNLPETWLLTLIFPAFAEEVIFRGVLQKHFIQRYGTWRGIFLVSIVWAAFHFFSDRFGSSTDAVVLFVLGARIVNCVALGFVLSWVTLRSKSLWPATMAHTIWNICVYTQFDPDFPGRTWLEYGLWCVLACCLFRYWPPQTEQPSEPQLAETKIEPA